MPYRNQRAATVAYLVAGLVGADTAAKPNIFFYLADDLSKWDVDHQVVPTPTINAFREEAVELTQMHTPMALCAPSRAVLYTGLYPMRNGVAHNHGSVNPGVKTLPHHLQPLGYTCLLSGKAHVRPINQFPFDDVLIEECVAEGGCLLKDPTFPPWLAEHAGTRRTQKAHDCAAYDAPHAPCPLPRQVVYATRMAGQL